MTYHLKLSTNNYEPDLKRKYIDPPNYNPIKYQSSCEQKLVSHIESYKIDCTNICTHTNKPYLLNKHKYKENSYPTNTIYTISDNNDVHSNFKYNDKNLSKSIVTNFNYNYKEQCKNKNKNKNNISFEKKKIKKEKIKRNIENIGIFDNYLNDNKFNDFTEEHLINILNYPINLPNVIDIKNKEKKMKKKL